MISQKDMHNLAGDYWKQSSNRYITYVLVGLAILAGGYTIYKKYNASLQMGAQKSFFNDISMLNKAKDSSGDKSDLDITLEDADVAFKNSAAQNSGSGIAPFFVAYESVVQSELGNEAMAKDVWQKAVESLGASDTSRMSDLYKLKLALMDIDQGIENGVERLKALAEDNQNKFQDLANYYLAEYYFSNYDFDLAKNHYAKTIEINADSYWAKAAKSKIEG